MSRRIDEPAEVSLLELAAADVTLSARTMSVEKRFFLAHRAALRAAAAVLARYAEPQEARSVSSVTTTSAAPNASTSPTIQAASPAAAASTTPAYPGSRAEPLTVWVVLPRRVPQLEEWAFFFAALAPKREALECGWPIAVTAREADDLVRQTRSFLDVVTRLLFGTSLVLSVSARSLLPVLPLLPSLPQRVRSGGQESGMPRERIGAST